MVAVLSVALLVVTAGLLAGLLSPPGLIERCVAAGGLAAVSILVPGYLASAVHRFSSLAWWVGFQTAWLVVIVAVVAVATPQRTLSEVVASWRSLPRDVRSRYLEWRRGFVALPAFERTLLGAMLTTCVFLGALNLWQVAVYAPHNWDGMTYHLARVAYFLQHDSLASYPANYWAQTIHPRGSAVLMAWVHLSFGRESLFQAVQYVAYWLTVVAVVGIGRRLLPRRIQAAFIGLAFALLVEVVLQATTVQNDLLIASFVASSLFFLLELGDRPNLRTALLTGLPLGLALGTKASVVLVLPSLGIVAVIVLAPRWRQLGPSVLVALALSCAIGSYPPATLRICAHMETCSVPRRSAECTRLKGHRRKRYC